MIKAENIEGALDTLYTELGREMVRHRLAIIEIGSLPQGSGAQDDALKRADAIEEKMFEMRDGIVKVVMSTKMKGASLL